MFPDSMASFACVNLLERLVVNVSYEVAILVVTKRQHKNEIEGRGVRRGR